MVYASRYEVMDKPDIVDRRRHRTPACNSTSRTSSQFCLDPGWGRALDSGADCSRARATLVSEADGVLAQVGGGVGSGGWGRRRKMWVGLRVGMQRGLWWGRLGVEQRARRAICRRL